MKKKNDLRHKQKQEETILTAKVKKIRKDFFKQANTSKYQLYKIIVKVNLAKLKNIFTHQLNVMWYPGQGPRAKQTNKQKRMIR